MFVWHLNATSKYFINNINYIDSDYINPAVLLWMNH